MLHQTAKKLLALVSIACVTQLMVPLAVWSASLDLSSTVHNVRAGSIAGFHPTAITAGGHLQNITANSLLTPAELQAVLQVLNTGTQSLLLSGRDAAVGGSALIQSSAALTGLVVPTGVKLVDQLNATNALSVTGNLSNAGSLYFAGSPTARTLTISTLSINNQLGAVLSSLTPGVGLTLTAARGITNAGTISSAGDLSLLAGGVIANTGTLQAAESVNLNSHSAVFDNAGLISAAAGNINFSAPNTSALSINGVAGIFQALQGSINVRDASDSKRGNTTLSGGDYLSQDLNIFSGNGKVFGNVDNVSGLLNVSACNAHFNSSSPNLNIGIWNVSGDPVISNIGNVTLSAPLTGSDFVIIAGINIEANNNPNFSINTSSTTGNGGNVVMVAGANFKGTTINGASATGGDILLPNLTGTLINTSSTKIGGTGGNVTLAAFASPTNIYGGHILGSPSASIITSGNGRASGNVTVVAQAASSTSTGYTVTLGDITTGTGKIGTGSVTIDTATPNTAKPIVISGSTGQITSGTFLGGTAQAGAVNSGNITTNGAAVAIASGANNGTGGNAGSAIQVGSITTSSALGAGGAVALTSGLANGTDEDISLQGPISTTGSSPTGSTGSGGSAQIIAGGNIIGGPSFAVDTTGGTGTGGNVVMVAGAAATPGGSGTSISGQSPLGGSIELATTTAVPVIRTITDSTANAGDVTLAAWGGGVFMPTGNFNNIVTGANGSSNSNGNVTIVASGTSPGAHATIELGNINTTGGQSGTGNITIGTLAPSATPVTIDHSGNVASGSFTAGNSASGSIYANSLTTDGGAVSISANSNAITGTAIAVNTIQTSSSSVSGGAVTLTSGTNGALTNAAVTVGSITTTGGPTVVNNSVGALYSGGSVSITSGGSITTGTIDTGDNASSTLNQIANGGANGGNVSLIASGAPGDIIYQNISTEGANGGNVLIGTTGTVGNILGGASTITTNSAAPQLIAKPLTQGFVAGSVEIGSLNGSVQFGSISTNAAGFAAQGGNHSGNVFIVAGSNITSSGFATAIDTSSSVGNAGDVILAAGANGSVNGAAITIAGRSGLGGDINIGSTVLNAISTVENNFLATNFAGTVTLLAYANSAGGATGGSVTVNNAITAGGPFTGLSGNVMVVAEAASTSTTPTYAISLSNVATAGGTSGSGYVTLDVATPNATAGSPAIYNVATGALTSGVLLGGAYQNGGVQVTGSINTDGGNIEVFAGNNLSGITPTNAINITGQLNTGSSTGPNGVISLMAGLSAGNTGDIHVGGSITTAAAPVAILTTGSISIGSGITTGGANGNVVLLAGAPIGSASSAGNAAGSISIQTVSTSGAAVAATTLGTGNIGGTSIFTSTSGNSGPVTISSGTGTISFSGSINTDAFNANGGDVFLSSGSSNASGTVVVTGGINTSAGGSGHAGQVYVFYNYNGGLTAMPSITTTQTDSNNSLQPGIIPSTIGGMPASATYAFVGGTGSSAPSGGNPNDTASFQTTVGSTTTIASTSNPAAWSPGGFSSFIGSSSLIINSTNNNNLLVPVISTGTGGISFTGSITSQTPVALLANTVSVNGSIFNSNGETVRLTASTGAISITSTTDHDFFINTAISPVNISLSNGANNFNLVLTGVLLAPQVSLSTAPLNSSTNNIGNSAIFESSLASEIFTQSLSLNAGGSIYNAQYGNNQGTPFQFSGGTDPAFLSASAYSMQITSVGTVFISNAQTPALVAGGPFQFRNDSALQIQTLPTSGDSGAIIIGGNLDSPNGVISLISSGSITTSTNCLACTITSDGNTGLPVDSANAVSNSGNYVYLVAGAKWSTSLTPSSPNPGFVFVTDRSGLGGDINLSGMDQILVTTSVASQGGYISLIAYSDTAIGLTGGHVSVPGVSQFYTLNVGAPFGIGTVSAPISNAFHTGIVVIGEALGHDGQPTISLGNIYGGLGSIVIQTATPNTFVAANNTGYLWIPNGNAGSYQNNNLTFGSQKNSSILTGEISALGTNGGNSIFVEAGDAITTASIIGIGAAAFGPYPPVLRSDNTSLNGFSGGTGDNVELSSTTGTIQVNGDIYTFGGGGGGGDGDPYVSPYGGQANAGFVAGHGGNGGGGGSVNVGSSDATIHITGNINTSGGGGGGGAGGFGGQGNLSSLGGGGGTGGSGGNISLQGFGNSATTVKIDGTILAAAGGAGGAGSNGNPGAGEGGGSGGGGGGSFGGGGGGGGAGLGAEGAGNDHSGLGGAGGGGFYAGGGGDILIVNNLTKYPDAASHNGIGGVGGGGFLNGDRGAGEAGGLNFQGFSAATGGSGTPGNQTGGLGGAYTTTSGSVFTFSAAPGGIFGNGGTGGGPAFQGVLSTAPNAAGDAATNGTNVIPAGEGGDGAITITATTIVTPSFIYGSDIKLFADQAMTIAGTMIATNAFTAQALNVTGADSITINPHLLIDAYGNNGGKVLLQTFSSSGTINIGANTEIFNEQNTPSITLVIGQTVSSVAGKTPANVKVVKTGSATINFGAGITASAPTNLISAIGNGHITFQTIAGQTKQITLGGNDQIGVSAAEPFGDIRLPNNSLQVMGFDLTNQATIAAVINLQQSGQIGGKLTFTTSTNTQNQTIFTLTGGNVILYPMNFAGSIPAFNIPKGITVTFNNFTDLNPIKVLVSPNSSTQALTMNGTAAFTGMVPTKAILDVETNPIGNNGPVFVVGSTGKITSAGNLSITGTGDLFSSSSTSGLVTATGTLTLETLPGALPLDINGTPVPANGSIFESNNVSGNAGVTILTEGTGSFSSTAGILSASAGSISITTNNVTIGTGTTKPSITDTQILTIGATGTITLNTGASVSSTKGLTWTSGASVLLAGNVTSSAGSVVITLSPPSTSTTNLTVGTAGGVGPTITGAKGIQLTLDTPSVGGTTQFNGLSGKLLSKTGTIEITADRLALAGMFINAGKGTAWLTPFSNNVPVSVNGSAAFNISSANLAFVTAGTLEVGSTTDNGSFMVGSSLNETGKTQAYNLIFNTGGTYTAAGQTFTLGTKTLTVDALGTITDPGSITGGSIVSITGASGLTIPATNTLSIAPTGTLTLSAGSGSGTLTIDSSSVQAAIVNLAAGSGGITNGTTGIISTNAKTLSVNTTGAADIVDSTPVSLAASHADTLTLDDSAAAGAKITVAGPVNTTNLTLGISGAATSGSIVLGANINATGTVSLTAKGAGTITQSLKTAVLGAQTLSLISGTGAIGSSAANIIASATNLSATTTGTLFVTDNHTVDITSASAKTINVIDNSLDNINDAIDAITVSGAVAANTVTLTATNPVSGSMLISASVSTNEPTTSKTGNINLTTGSGTLTIGSNLTANGGGISIRNLATTTGSIVFSNLAQVTTFITGTGKSVPAQITVSLGSAKVSLVNPLTTSANLVVTNNGGTVFAGPTPAAIIGPSSGPAANAQAQGSNVVFNSPSVSDTITINSGVLIEADPVVSGTVPTMLSSVAQKSTAPVTNLTTSNRDPVMSTTGSAPARAIMPIVHNAVPTDERTNGASTFSKLIDKNIARKDGAPQSITWLNGDSRIDDGNSQAELVVDTADDADISDIVVSEPLHAVGY